MRKVYVTALAGCLALGIAAPALAGTRQDDLVMQLKQLVERQQEQLDRQAREIAALREQFARIAENGAARQEEQKAKKKPEEELTTTWKNGLRFTSDDKKFNIKLGGRVHLDWANIDADSPMQDTLAEAEGNPLEGNGFEFRRARLYVAGDIYSNVTFKVQYDFAGGDADFRDVYVGLKKLPAVGTILFGQQKEPFSLEYLTSSNYTTFMERSLPVAFGPGRNTGIKMFNTALDRRLTWAIGWFDDADDFGDSFNDVSSSNVTMRLTGLPWYADNGAGLLHLGLSYSHQFRDEDSDITVRYRERPEAHISDARMVNTGKIHTDGVDLAAFELAAVYGPLSLQGEYLISSVDSTEADDPDFSGYYVYGSWFITGEHRPYKTGSGAFGRVKPIKDFAIGSDGWGAWEIALRYSDLDLGDAAIQGGRLKDFTAGLNWYLNPNLRWMLNYVHADLSERADVNDGNADIIETRMSLTF